ncbi:hypothetical protein CFC21_100154 [Triticum aestivum]|uniref:Terpene synthase n=3 Tax=Triticum TaxID=4564 RepID=A0A9R1BTK3_TRITD|nr:hypothetical protein CFC21_100154 [Triticum aestivum]VAI80682.1 unnamed protein product [Triticum turgidum subsp. durum]
MSATKGDVRTSSREVGKGYAVDYPPSVWGDYFIKNPTLPHTHEMSVEWMIERRDKLVIEAREMLLATCSPFAEMKMIDALQRLGVSYHLEEEINMKLQKLLFREFDTDCFHEISLQFRLLRQGRCYMSCDVFKSFVNSQGCLKASIQSDPQALLAPYEATFLRTPNESFLHEAQEQTTSLLRSIVDHLEKPLGDEVRHVLKTPSFRRMKRLEARLYIPLYQENKECSGMLLELAKLDFYLLQRIHRQEVKEICEWYYGLDSPKKLFYARHRQVETYMWVLGICYEPQYAKTRILFTKYTSTMTPCDDTFDNYGVWEELQPFVDVVQRWNMEDLGQLKECYQDFARFIFGTMIEIENALPIETASRDIKLLRDLTNEACKSYLTEAAWKDSQYIPTLEEHLKVTGVSTCYKAMIGLAFVTIEENLPEEILLWMSKYPQIIKDTCCICRLMDDIVCPSEVEEHNVATTVACYMKEYGATKEVATEALCKIVDDAWIDMNKEYLTLTLIPSSLLMIVINHARVMETMYKKEDGYKNTSILKEEISMLLEKPIPF